MKTELLYLNEADMIKAGVLDMKKCVETIEEVFRIVDKGDYIMGGPGQNEHGSMLHFPETTIFPNMPIKGPDRRFMAMLGYLGGEFNITGVKWYGSNIDNVKTGLPRSVLVLVLNNVVTGEPIAFMSANLISSMRTGTVIGVAAKYLLNTDSETVGIIGAGVINRSSLMSLHEVMPNLKTVKVYDLFLTKAEEFCSKMGSKIGLNLKPVDSLEEAVKNSDFVHVAVSGGNLPLIRTKWIKEGAVIGTSSACRFEEGFFNGSNIVLDNLKMHESWHEIDKNNHLPIASSEIINKLKEGSIKKESIIDLGSLVAQNNKNLLNQKKNTIFIPDGMIVEDIAWGYVIYKNAMKLGIGQKLTLWDKPFWF